MANFGSQGPGLVRTTRRLLFFSSSPPDCKTSSAFEPARCAAFAAHSVALRLGSKLSLGRPSLGPGSGPRASNASFSR